MSNFPQNVYARNLLSHRGYPLWAPEPHIELPDTYQREGLRIGDVGAVVPEDGSFDVFFNITLPRDHPLHAPDGVPDNFSQVELRREDYRIAPDAENAGRVISSSSVECTIDCVDPFDLDGTARSLTDHQFTLCRNEGAMLILPEGAQRHRLAKELLLLDLVIQNAVGWYRFAREKLYRNISNDALYLVTGFHKASSWSLASFQNTVASSARCKLVQARNGGPVLTTHSTWVTVHPLEWRIGPRCSTGFPNQSVFITGFNIAVNEELLHLKRVTVVAEHTRRTLASTLVGFGAGLANLALGGSSGETYSPDAAAQDETGDNAETGLGEDVARRGYTTTLEPQAFVALIEVVRVTRFQPFHPCDVINRYLLTVAPTAKIAVIHDSQWIALIEDGKITSEELIQEGRLEALISHEYRITIKNGAVYLQNIGSDPITPSDSGLETSQKWSPSTPGYLYASPSLLQANDAGTIQANAALAPALDTLTLGGADTAKTGAAAHGYQSPTSTSSSGPDRPLPSSLQRQRSLSLTACDHYLTRRMAPRHGRAPSVHPGPSAPDHDKSTLVSIDFPPPLDLTPRVVKIGDQHFAQGGFGNVYRCWYIDNLIPRKVQVAVKAVRFKFTLDGDGDKSSKMVRRELGIWKRLNHRNVVPFLGIAYGFGMHGSMSLVSLWMPNDTLHNFLTRHDDTISVVHRLQLLLDIANGLEYLHSFSIVHGDLNSNNVLLDEDYTARLSDFGYASLVGNVPEALVYLRRSTPRPGALRWAAPEQISLEDAFSGTTKSDIYSFGCLALQVLSGKQPWSEVREDAAVVLRLAMGYKPGRPESRPMDDSHWDLIDRCWSSTEERPTAEAIIDSIQRFMTLYPPFQPVRDIMDGPSSPGHLVDSGRFGGDKENRMISPTGKMMPR